MASITGAVYLWPSSLGRPAGEVVASTRGRPARPDRLLVGVGRSAGAAAVAAALPCGRAGGGKLLHEWIFVGVPEY